MTPGPGRPKAWPGLAWGGQSLCSELNCDPQKTCPCPGTCEVTYSEEKGLCSCNQVKDLKVRSSCVSYPGGPEAQSHVSLQKTHRGETGRGDGHVQMETDIGGGSHEPRNSWGPGKGEEQRWSLP